MSGDVNINLDNLPESPLFWILVAVGIFLVLLATGHTATAVVFLFLSIAIVTFIGNISSSNPSNVLWVVCIICALLALILGVIQVPSEWHKSTYIFQQIS